MQLTLLLSLLPLASAGYSYGAETTAASPSPSTAAQQQTVAGVTRINVGQNGLTMEPKDVTVPAGETIEFHFFTGSHSVAQSAFDSPCTPLAVNGTEGFFSGAQAVSSGEGANVFRVVSTGSPMWYYCATGRHCQGGMVGVINKPSNGRTIQQYALAAASVSQNVAPASARGGSVVPAGSTVTPGSDGVGSLGRLSLSMLGLTVVAAALAI